jgi:hypothetical protein
MALQIELIGNTHVRAQDVHRIETGTWVISSLSGLSIPVGNPSDKIGTETVIDSKLWDHTPLPHTVTPSFETCNLARSYQLDVKVTIGYGHPGQIQVSLAPTTSRVVKINVGSHKHNFFHFVSLFKCTPALHRQRPCLTPWHPDLLRP